MKPCGRLRRERRQRGDVDPLAAPAAASPATRLVAAGPKAASPAQSLRAQPFGARRLRRLRPAWRCGRSIACAFIRVPSAVRFSGDRAIELVGGLGELLDPVLDQLVGDALEVEAEPLGGGQHRLGLVDPLVSVRRTGRGRGRRPWSSADGVDRLRADQRLDVEHVG